MSFNREFGSEFSITPTPNGYFDKLIGYGNTALVRSGRESLKLAALSCEKRSGTALLPAYSCESMSEPFQLAGFTIEYYSLNSDLTPVIEHMSDLILTTGADVVLTMNYFGIADTRSAVGVIKKCSNRTKVIEDFSHCLFSLEYIYNNDVDYYAASIRKSIGIDDGGILIGMNGNSVRHDLVCPDTTEFVRLRREALHLKEEYNYTKDTNTKTIFREMLAKAERSLNEFSDIYVMSDESLDVIKSLDARQVSFARNMNYRHLRGLLESNKTIRLLPNIKTPEVPFSLPVLVENRNYVQKLLSARGVYAPVLWPLSEQKRNVCRVSCKMSDNMLSIPIDHRYRYEDIEEISSIISNVSKFIYG